uniref:Splicing factor 3B subunit 6-like protein n=1 Tax=Schistocephalus solidus TaxID=70667 RepID=A0A0X3PZ86_SCHSO
MCTRRQLISFGPGRVQSVFGLQVVQCFAFLVHVNLLELLVLLVVEDNKISIADVETAKMITGIFLRQRCPHTQPKQYPLFQVCFRPGSVEWHRTCQICHTSPPPRCCKADFSQGGPCSLLAEVVYLHVSPRP